ncbi:type I-E CRISPR-associated endoribonuclease Cas2 [Streptomyces sp. ECR3]|uniref:type I-E CRISPR-associated endoribonuclease Cas2 n=1 Tax=Streptomyces sp. ECR3 TaxID=3400630 RepID=UPI003F1A6F8E
MRTHACIEPAESIPNHPRPESLTETVGDGAAVLIHPAPTGQGYATRTVGTRRRAPEDFGGLTLIRMRAAKQAKNEQSPR